MTVGSPEAQTVMAAMISTPADVRIAFERFQDALDVADEPFDWSFSDVKRAFEHWLAQGGQPSLSWDDVTEHQVAIAMSRRYQPYLVSTRRWFR
jgi:hypothetical protein